ncbi:MAG TPA: carbohydrate binding family 9 domain-containing protein [Acidobacteriaceae bacterium]|nr:carbohydrate binding family 9 domain-containing protein [Acidobacteriaceae bacterium]
MGVGRFFRVRMWAAGGLVVALFGIAAGAQVNQDRQGKPTVTPAVPPRMESTRSSDVTVPELDHGLTLADFEGMEPRPDLRARLTHVGGFIQNTPTDGAPATERTQVWLGRTRTELYVVFLCFDKHPELIRSHLARRENITKDDYVTVNLDPFQDRQRGVEFQVNPAGVQADAAWTEANGADYSYDQVWDSEGKITSKGWMAVLAIPFRSLRFPASGTTWGVVFWRNLPRNSENDWWPRVSANVSGMLSQEGTMHLPGMEGVSGSHNVQINPYTLGQSVHTLETLDPMNPYFSTRNAEATAGGEAKAVLKDAIVFDATVNPDFSDVESDQPQFTVNQRYPVYFPELRPFFLENASYFQTPMMLLYTRDIVHPEIGGRVTGKVGHTNLGLLAIDDREPGETVPDGDPLFKHKAQAYVGRVSEDLGKGSNVGLMYTDEEFGGGWNRIGGADFTWRANDHWTVLGQMVASSTRPTKMSSAAAIFPAKYGSGPATDVQVQRNGHSFSLFDEYQDISAGFDSLLGFFQTSNIRSDHLHSEYQWFPKHSVVQSYGLETDQHVAYDHAHNRVYHYSTFDPFWLLPRNVVVAPIGGENSDTVGPQNGYPLAASENFTENFGGFVARGQPWAQLNFNLTALRSGNVNYNPPAGQTPFLLNQETVSALVSVNPLRQLTADNTYLLDRDFNAHTNAFVYETQTFRTKLNYQFTRAFSARMIVEYDTTLANPMMTTLQRTKQVQTQALLTWLPHPGTAIYVGWNSDLQNYNHTLCSRMGGTCDPTQPILPRGPGYLNDGRQFFVKASYLLRF